MVHFRTIFCLSQSTTKLLHCHERAFFFFEDVDGVWGQETDKHRLVQYELKLHPNTAAYCAVVSVSVLLNCQTDESLALICRLTVCQLSDSAACLAVNTGWRGNSLQVPRGFVVVCAFCVSILLPPPHVSPGANKTEDCG